MSADPRRSIAIYGASGHGLAVAMVLRGQSTYPLAWQVSTFIDDTPGKIGAELGGVPVVSFARWSESSLRDPCLVALGNPRSRRLLVERIHKAGGHFCHLYSDICLPYDSPKIGVGSFVAQMVYIGPNVNICNHVQIMPMTSMGHDVMVEDFVTICPGCTVSGHVVIEEGAFIGAGAIITNGSAQRPMVIGKGSTVGAGSCVTKNVPPGATVSGNPARSMRELARMRRNQCQE